MTKTRFKRANIFFFLLIVMLVAYLFNQDLVEQKLIEWGWKTLPDTTTYAPTNLDMPDEAEADTLSKTVLPDTTELNTETNLALWSILTQGEENFYIGGDNNFMVQAAEIAASQIIPVVNGNKVSIETIDAAKGLYRLNAGAAGKVDISLFYTNRKGATDLLGSQSFTILAKAPPQKPETGYLWNILTQIPDTLLLGNNTLQIAVAEIDASNIEASISGTDNELTLVNAKEGKYNAYISSPELITITVKINNGNRTRLLGSRQFAVKGNKAPISKPVSTPKMPLMTVHSMVLYAGVPNALYLQLPDSEKTEPEVLSSNGTVSGSSGAYLLTPARTGKLFFVLKSSSNKAILLNKEFEVVESPNPSVTIGGSTGGETAVTMLRNVNKLELVNAPGFDEPNFEVVSFEANFYSAGRTLVKINNSGAKFNTEINQQLLRMNPTDLLYLNKVQITGTDGSKRTLPGVGFVAK